MAQSKYFHPLIRELLVDPEVNYYPKRECLATFLEYAQKKNFAMFLQDVVQFFKPHIPKVNAQPNYTTAYWIAYALCVFLVGENFEKKLNKAFKQLVDSSFLLSVTGLNLEAEILAVLLLRTTELHPLFEDNKYICKLLDADVNKYENLLEVYKTIK